MKAGRVAAQLRAIFVENLWLKLAALAISFLLWWAVAKDPRSEITLNVPIELHHIPSGLEISSETIADAQLRVRGPASKLRELRPSDVHAEIDLASAQPGERTYELTPQQIHPPSGIEVMEVLPVQYRISFDRPTMRVVTVRAHVVGNFASDRRIARVITEPAELTIRGPSRHVGEVEAALTDPVDASGVMERETFITHAYVADPLVQIVNLQPIRVTIVMEKAPPR